MRPDIRPGGIFPDYALPDHIGTVRTLGELQGRDPLILTLARGNYCPKEHQQHLELAANYSKIAVAYTQIATIATDDHHTLQEFRASVGAQWTFLSDPGRTVQKDLDIRAYTDPEHNPMIPHTLVSSRGASPAWGLPSQRWPMSCSPPWRSARMDRPSSSCMTLPTAAGHRDLRVDWDPGGGPGRIPAVGAGSDRRL